MIVIKHWISSKREEDIRRPGKQMSTFRINLKYRNFPIDLYGIINMKTYFYDCFLSFYFLFISYYNLKLAFYMYYVFRELFSSSSCHYLDHLLRASLRAPQVSLKLPLSVPALFLFSFFVVESARRGKVWQTFIIMQLRKIIKLTPNHFNWSSVNRAKSVFIFLGIPESSKVHFCHHSCNLYTWAAVSNTAIYGTEFFFQLFFKWQLVPPHAFHGLVSISVLNLNQRSYSLVF